MPELSAVASRRIEWSDTDASGHHHNSVVWRHVEAAEAELMRQAGVLKEFFHSAPRVHQEVDYENKLYFGQLATTRVWLERLGTSSITFRFEMWGDEYEGRPERRVASGRWVAVHVEAGTERSSPWPPELRRALEGAEGAGPAPGAEQPLAPHRG